MLHRLRLPALAHTQEATPGTPAWDHASVSGTHLIHTEKLAKFDRRRSSPESDINEGLTILGWPDRNEALMGDPDVIINMTRARTFGSGGATMYFQGNSW